MKKRLIMSAMMVALVCALVGGATFAYFTSSATNSGNTFTAGTVSLTANTQDSKPLFGANGTALVDTSNIFPGWEDNASIFVSNTGNLPIEWFAYVTDGGGSLKDLLQVKVVSPNVGTGTPDNPLVLLDWTDLSNLIGSDSTTMDTSVLKWDGDTAGAMQTNYDNIEYKIYVRCKDTNDNNYQGATFTGNLVFKAIQYPNS
ncbi:TasA family protein [Thermincola ferriacetica]